MKTHILFGEEARQKLLSGMEKVFKAVAPTLGSHGKNVALTRFQIPRIINDGVTIAKKINLPDLGENMGADFIKEVAIRTNEEAGDGTSTATILTYYLITAGFKILRENTGMSPLFLRKELEEALEVALEKLSKRAIKIEGDEELRKIARISSDNDRIAELVTKAFRESGETGRVVVEPSQRLKTDIEKIEGMEIEGGYISSYFVTHPERQEAVLDNPYVLVTDKTFALQDTIIPIMEEIKRSGAMNLVVVCKDAQAEALACMLGNKLQGKFNIIAVKAPHTPDMLKDLANFTGKQDAWTDENTIHKPSLHNCTRLQKVVAYKDKTLFIKGTRTDTEKSIYNARVDTLVELIKNFEGDDKRIFEDRLARITSSVVLIRVGASSSTEMDYELLKIEDAVNAVKSAMKEGYVTGGGLTLADVTRETMHELQTNGSILLHWAGIRPVQTLVENSGVEFDENKITATDGFDTDTGKYEKNLLERGIIDPVLVEKKALVNAVSLAGLVITLESLIIDVPEKPVV